MSCRIKARTERVNKSSYSLGLKIRAEWYAGTARSSGRVLAAVIA